MPRLRSQSSASEHSCQRSGAYWQNSRTIINTAVTIASSASGSRSPKRSLDIFHVIREELKSVSSFKPFSRA